VGRARKSRGRRECEKIAASGQTKLGDCEIATGKGGKWKQSLIWNRAAGAQLGRSVACDDGSGEIAPRRGDADRARVEKIAVREEELGKMEARVLAAGGKAVYIVEKSGEWRLTRS
jgi:hypothetical protein